MPKKAANDDDWKDLPDFVRLNPSKSGMFDDREFSGLIVKDFGVENAKTEIKNYAHVPKKNDCSRIQHALNVQILVRCNPKGEAVALGNPVFKDVTDTKSIEAMMTSKNAREIIAIAEKTRSASFVSSMLDWEKSRPKKEQRGVLLQHLTLRLKSRELAGVTKLGMEPAMILDEETGEMVRDTVQMI